MANLAKAVWFKDNNGNVCELGNGASIVNGELAFAKDEHGNVWQIWPMGPSKAVLISSNVPTDISLIKQDNTHYKIHLHVHDFDHADYFDYKIALQDSAGNIVPIKTGKTTSTDPSQDTLYYYDLNESPHEVEIEIETQRVDNGYYETGFDANAYWQAASIYEADIYVTI